ncbi:GNAT family N-acetyltransferase [Pigmentiphaga aceris]|uniref:GNAT family N-acetyltransferase n=1 Tax=Pigmentiphaga aceris TaxID=1940612 RepID=A0A5C0B7S8_9BURK|nr:GNAT family N-acetyltransferase [Pigmentiphaga aceris]QEI08827.1 GNAT family N-acetyltransferase [Pigmentiphaga aceris]
MSFEIARFDPSASYTGFRQFDCGHRQINKFVQDSLKKQVKQGLSVAYAVLEADALQGAPDRFAGFYTISNHLIAATAISALQLGSLPKTIPCVRLTMLGINLGDAKKGLGTQLIAHALDVTKANAANIGCFGMYLDADAGAIPFYQKLGFHLLNGDCSPAPSPMFITLSATL